MALMAGLKPYKLPPTKSAENGPGAVSAAARSPPAWVRPPTPPSQSTSMIHDPVAETSMEQSRSPPFDLVSRADALILHQTDSVKAVVSEPSTEDDPSRELISILQRDLESEKKHSNDLHQQLNEHSRGLAERSKRIIQLEHDIDVLAKQMSELKHLSSIEDIEVWKSRSEQLESACNAFKGTCKHLENQVTNLQHQLKESESRLIELAESQEQARQSWEAQQKDWAEHISQFHLKAQKKDEIIQRLRQEVGAFQQKSGAIESSGQVSSVAGTKQQHDETKYVDSQSASRDVQAFSEVESAIHDSETVQLRKAVQHLSDQLKQTREGHVLRVRQLEETVLSLQKQLQDTRSSPDIEIFKQKMSHLEQCTEELRRENRILEDKVREKRSKDEPGASSRVLESSRDPGDTNFAVLLREHRALQGIVQQCYAEIEELQNQLKHSEEERQRESQEGGYKEKYVHSCVKITHLIQERRNLLYELDQMSEKVSLAEKRNGNQEAPSQQFTETLHLMQTQIDQLKEKNANLTKIIARLAKKALDQDHMMTTDSTSVTQETRQRTRIVWTGPDDSDMKHPKNDKGIPKTHGK